MTSRIFDDDGVIIDVLPEQLGAKGRIGAYVSSVSRFTTLVLMLGAQAVMARMISPAEYGLSATGQAILNFLLIFREFGFQSAGVQKLSLNQREASILFFGNLATISCVGLVGFIVAPIATRLYQEPRLYFVIIAMVLASMIGGISAQHSMLLRRRFEFSKIAVIEVFSWLTAIIFALPIAYYWQAANSTLTFAFMRWKPVWPKSFSGTGGMLAFSLNMVGVNIITFLTNNFSTFLVGFNFSSVSLGQFNRAQQINSLPSLLISSSISNVVFGTLSRLHSDAIQYRDFYCLSLKRTSVLFFATSGLLMVAGDDIVEILLGPRWHSAGLFVRLMSFSLIGAGMAQMTSYLYQSQGRLRELQTWGVVDGVIRIAAILIGIPFGLVGIIISFSLATTLITAPCAMYFVGRKGAVRFFDQISSLAPAAFCLVSVFLATLLVKENMREFGLISRFTFEIFTFLLMLLLNSLVFLDLLNYFKPDSTKPKH
jgi:polysaccharide transporter, PST family